MVRSTALWRRSGGPPDSTSGKRQVEDLAARAAVDFDTFHLQRQAPTGAVTEVLVISCDGKGILMRPGALRRATAKAAASTNQKLATRLSKGEKRNRRRLAEVGAVYDATPVPRSTADILTGNDTQPRDATAGPSAPNRWLTASVVDHAATVVAAIFEEADRRDPAHQRSWIALVDGDNHQIDRIHAEALARKVTVPIIIDFVQRPGVPLRRLLVLEPRRRSPLPKPASALAPKRSWAAVPPASPAPSDEQPPPPAWSPLDARTPTPAPPT